jgi:hypothetical protein
MNDNPLFDADQPLNQGVQQADNPGVQSQNPLFDADEEIHNRPAWQKQPVVSGDYWPITKYSDGSIGFDSSAGVLGSITRALRGFPQFASDVGQETAENTATPATAGKSLGYASMFAPVGDVLDSGAAANMTKAFRSVPDKPTTDELYATSKGQFQAARDLGVDFSPEHVGNWAFGVQQALDQDGNHAILAPKTHAILSTLQNPGNAIAVPLTGLEAARRAFGKLAGGADATEGGAAATAKSALTDFMENPPREAVLAGPASPAADLYLKGRGNYGAAKRSDTITGRDDAAEYAAARANSGRNFDNALRQRISPLVAPGNPQNRELNGFTDAEKDAVSGLVTGTTPRNLSRTAGNMLAGGHGIGATLLGIAGGEAGYHALGPSGLALGAAPVVAGSMLKSNANRLARNAVDSTDEMIRARSPLYEERTANAPMTLAPNALGIAAIRAAATPMEGDNQPQYAKGGSVEKPSHEFLVNRLMKLAEKAKRDEKRATAPILKLPDDAVTYALALANKYI